MYFVIIRHMKQVLPIVLLVGTLCAAAPLFGATETRTFKLTYASAVEVAERLNGQMCREIGPDGKPFRVATAYEEANAVSVTASPETVKACSGIVADVDVKPKQVYVEARFVALNAVEMRNLGLKWNMLQSGVGIASANASAGISARRVRAARSAPRSAR